MNRFIKDLLSIALSKGSIIIFNIGKAIIIARWLGPELNGILSALVVYPAIFMTIGSLGISQATTYYVGKEIYSIQRIKKAIVHLWLISTLFSIVVCFLLIRNFSNAGYDLVLVLLAILPVPFNLFNSYNSGVFLGRNDISGYNKIKWLPAFITFIATCLLIVGLSFSTKGALIAYAVGPFVMSIILLFRNNFIRLLSLKVELEVIKSLASLGIIYAIALVTINLNYKADVIMMDKLSSAYELGIYSKGAALVEYLWEIPMLFSTIVFARSAVSKNEKAFSVKVSHLLRLSILSVGGCSLIMVVLSEWLIYTMFGSDFLPSASVLAILAPGVLLLTIFKVLNMDLAGKGKPWISMKAMIPSLIVNIILNLFLIPRYGADGAAFSSTVSYSVGALLFMLFYSLEVKMPIKTILNFTRGDFDILKNLINSSKEKPIKL